MWLCELWEESIVENWKELVSTIAVSNRKKTIDMAAVKESIDVGEVVKVEWIDRKKQVAVCLTKVGKLLMKCISTTNEKKEKRLKLRVFCERQSRTKKG